MPETDERTIIGRRSSVRKGDANGDVNPELKTLTHSHLLNKTEAKKLKSETEFPPNDERSKVHQRII